MSTYEYINGERVRREETFRVYHNMEGSFRHHADLLVNRWWSIGRLVYAQAMQYTDEAQKLGQAFEGVYATDPNYAESLIRLIDQCHLDQYDA
jgi:flagellum-specific peptidoglycan hydrolase FlgJ